ncbi:MAG: AI-2E family transporter [Deltaproteobacteria bacterium]|nr:AI-2E family transporter [Deltaproteobacteria bacterium]
MAEKTTGNLILWFFLGCLLVSTLMLGWLFWPFVSIIVLGAVITGIFSPIYTFMQRSGKIRASLASLIVCGLIFFILFIPTIFFVGVLSSEAYDLYQTARNAVISERFQSLIEGSMILEKANAILVYFNIELTGQELNKGISEIGKYVGFFLYDQARDIASNMLAFIVNFFLMLIVIYYLLIDGGRLISFIVDLSPLPGDQERKLIKKFKDMAGAILIGNGLCGLIQGALGGIVFYVLGLNSPFLWGVIMGLLAFLPIIGIGMILIPTAIYLFLTGHPAAGIFMIIFYVVLSGGIEYIFKPKLVGHRVKMHTLLVFFSIIGGLKLFGILGIIYGPLVITAFLTLTDIYKASYQYIIETRETEVSAEPQ